MWHAHTHAQLHMYVPTPPWPVGVWGWPIKDFTPRAAKNSVIAGVLNSLSALMYAGLRAILAKLRSRKPKIVSVLRFRMRSLQMYLLNMSTCTGDEETQVSTFLYIFEDECCIHAYKHRSTYQYDDTTRLRCQVLVSDSTTSAHITPLQKGEVNLHNFKRL